MSITGAGKEHETSALSLNNWQEQNNILASITSANTHSFI